MSASVCAPHFLVLPTVRPLSHVPACRGGGSARVSHAPLQLHVRLPLHDRCGGSDGCRRAVWPQARQAVTHSMARTGRLPTSWTRKPISMRTGHLRNRGLRCVRVILSGPFRRCRPRPPLHAACWPAGVASTGLRCGHGPANRRRPWPERLDEGSCAIDRNRIPSAQEPRARTRAGTVCAPSPRASRPRTGRRSGVGTPLVNFVNAAS